MTAAKPQNKHDDAGTGPQTTLLHAEDRWSSECTALSVDSNSLVGKISLNALEDI